MPDGHVRFQDLRAEARDAPLARSLRERDGEQAAETLSLQIVDDGDRGLRDVRLRGEANETRDGDPLLGLEVRRFDDRDQRHVIRAIHLREVAEHVVAERPETAEEPAISRRWRESVESAPQLAGVLRADMPDDDDRAVGQRLPEGEVRSRLHA